MAPTTRKTSVLADTLMALAGPSSRPEARPSPQSSDYELQSPLSPVPEDDDHPQENEEEDPLPNPDDQPEEEEHLGAKNADNVLSKSLTLLASKIGAIADTPKSRSSVKPRTPDSFDGSDPYKLEAFTFQCSMYISARSSDFPDDESRVTFALSYLKGSALEWFSTELNHAMSNKGKFPDWFLSYTKFISELNRTFGPRDPVADAMSALESLRYKDSSKATRYTIDFNKHARRTGWNNAALLRQYYRGLPDRIKDEVSRVGKPVRLQELQDLVAKIDQRYWERQSEISREKKASTPVPPKPSTSDNRPASTASSSSNNNNNNNQQSKKDQKKPQASSTSTSSGVKANSIADVLGPDGKLKPEERKRRMDNNLCLRCGYSGHMASDCPRTSKTPAQARAATAAPEATPVPESESGKA